jgi:hypothetical protein
VLVAVALVAFLLGGDAARHAADLPDGQGPLAPFHAFVATLPADVLVAGSPRVLDGVPLYSKRRAFANYECSHPLYRAYHDEMQRRHREVLHALYATRVEELERFASTTGVTHLVWLRKDLSGYAAAARAWTLPQCGQLSPPFSGMEPLLGEWRTVAESADYLALVPTRLLLERHPAVVYQDELLVVVELGLITAP